MNVFVSLAIRFFISSILCISGVTRFFVNCMLPRIPSSGLYMYKFSSPTCDHTSFANGNSHVLLAYSTFDELYIIVMYSEIARMANVAWVGFCFLNSIQIVGMKTARGIRLMRRYVFTSMLYRKMFISSERKTIARYAMPWFWSLFCFGRLLSSHAAVRSAMAVYCGRR